MLLGAGASFASDFHLPTMKNFFDDRSKYVSGLSGFLESFCESESEEDRNLEEVLTHLHLSEVRDAAWTGHSREDIRLFAIGGLYPYIVQQLNTMGEAICSIHKRLFGALRRGDSVITLNYDLIADATLHHVGRATAPGVRSRVEKLWKLIGAEVRPCSAMHEPAGGMGPFEDGYYLKLHGSLDWSRCMEPTCPNRQGFRHLSDRIGMPYEQYCPHCGAVTQPFLVPPIRSKTTLISGRVQLMWTHALRALMYADRVAVIGVSFAPSDVDLRWLIRRSRNTGSGNRPYVHIVNPCSKTRARTKELFGHYSYCTEWDGLKEFAESWDGEGWQKLDAKAPS